MGATRNKYEIGTRIGGGGMASVFRATATGADGFARPVAIKRVHAALSSEPEFAAMFVKEARLAALLDHRNIVAVRDFDRDDEGRHFLVMELVEGVSLAELVGRGPVPSPLVALIVCELLQGLAYAHELVHEGKPLGIVHRDVSPHNVMVSWDGGVKLLDFGVARAVAATRASLAGPGGTQRSLRYISPEQARGDQADARSDVFAAGAVFYELVAGHPLFAGQTEAEVVGQVLEQPIPDVIESVEGVAPELRMVLLRMLERDAAQRYQSARSALEAILAAGDVAVRGSSALADLLNDRFPRRGSADGPQSVAESHAVAARRAVKTPAEPRAKWRATWVVLAAVVVLAGAAVWATTRSVSTPTPHSAPSGATLRADAGTGKANGGAASPTGMDVSTTPAAPRMPDGWTIQSDDAVPKRNVELFARSRGFQLRAVRKTVYVVDGLGIQLNTVWCVDAEAAKKVERVVLQGKLAQFVVRVGSVVFEFVGTDETIPMIIAGRAHLTRLAREGKL